MPLEVTIVFHFIRHEWEKEGRRQDLAFFFFCSFCVLATTYYCKKCVYVCVYIYIYFTVLFIYVQYIMHIINLVTKSCLTLCNSMDSSPPHSSVHRTLQARILEWVTISSSRGSSQPRGQTHISCIGRWVLYHWATREALTTDTGVESIIRLEYNGTGIKNNIDHNSGLESLEGGRETQEKLQLLPPHTGLSDFIREWLYFTDQARLEVRRVSSAFPLIWNVNPTFSQHMSVC